MIGYWRSTAVLVMACLLVCGGCATTKVVESWKDPSVTGPLRFKKILVIVVHPETYTRRAAEDELVKQIGADRAIPGDQILTDADRADVQKVKAKVKQSGVDGVVTMRLGGATTRTAASPGYEPYGYESMWNDYDRDMSAGDRSSGGVHSTNVLSIRTRIYSVADEKLVWTGVSDVIDPKHVRQIMADVAKAVGKRLREEHLIQ